MSLLRAVMIIMLAGGMNLIASPSGATIDAADYAIPPSPYRILGISLSAPAIDAVVPCLGDTPLLDEFRDALEKEGAAAALSQLNRVTDLDDPLTSPEIRLVDAILRARVNPKRTESAILRDSLAHRLARNPSESTADAPLESVSPKTRACAWLELARLELRTGLVPEARLSALRALRSFEGSGIPDEIQRGVIFYQAESLAGTGDNKRALEAYRKLSGGDDAIARAARLRLADAMQILSPTRNGRIAVQKSLAAMPESTGAARAQWAARIAEWAISDGDREGAMRWLESANDTTSDLPEDLAAGIAIRRADLQYAIDTRASKAAGRKILRELSENASSRSVQRLATVREVDLSQRSGEGTVRQLEAIFQNEDGGGAAYAGTVLVRYLLAAERYAPALETLVSLVYQRADASEFVVDPSLFGQTLSALATNDTCDEWIAHVSGRRDLLLRHTTLPEPFLRLGDCYQQNGMAASALETYRGIAKTFGPSAVGSVTLRSAQAEFQLGRLLTARAAAETNVKRAVEPREGWRILLARIQRFDGFAAKALQTLKPVMKRIAKTPNRPLEAGDRETILLDARAAAAAEPNSTDRSLLLRALEHAASQAEENESLAEVYLITADLYRQAGEFAVARRLYAPAFSELDEGPLRSRAAYWQGMLASDPDESRALWARVADDADPWARLAVNEIALAAGRAEVGASLSVPPMRLLQSSSQSSSKPTGK